MGCGLVCYVPHLTVLRMRLLMCLCRDVETRKATPMDVQTNPFCAAGMHLPNGSFATFGGNGATSPGELCFDFFFL